MLLSSFVSSCPNLVFIPVNLSVHEQAVSDPSYPYSPDPEQQIDLRPISSPPPCLMPLAAPMGSPHCTLSLGQQLALAVPKHSYGFQIPPPPPQMKRLRLPSLTDIYENCALAL